MNLGNSLSIDREENTRNIDLELESPPSSYELVVALQLIKHCKHKVIHKKKINLWSSKQKVNNIYRLWSMLGQNYPLECITHIGRPIGTHWTICWSRLDDGYFDFIGRSDLIEQMVWCINGWSDGLLLEMMTMSPYFHFITPKCFICTDVQIDEPTLESLTHI